MFSKEHFVLCSTLCACILLSQLFIRKPEQISQLIRWQEIVPDHFAWQNKFASYYYLVLIIIFFTETKFPFSIVRRESIRCANLGLILEVKK